FIYEFIAFKMKNKIGKYCIIFCNNIKNKRTVLCKV
ncbi:hypothetical protein QEI_1201, partial [Clostridioides difficile CD129]